MPLESRLARSMHVRRPLIKRTSMRSCKESREASSRTSSDGGHIPTTQTRHVAGRGLHVHEVQLFPERRHGCWLCCGTAATVPLGEKATSISHTKVRAGLRWKGPDFVMRLLPLGQTPL